MRTHSIYTDIPHRVPLMSFPPLLQMSPLGHSPVILCPSLWLWTDISSVHLLQQGKLQLLLKLNFEAGSLRIRNRVKTRDPDSRLQIQTLQTESMSVASSLG